VQQSSGIFTRASFRATKGTPITLVASIESNTDTLAAVFLLVSLLFRPIEKKVFKVIFFYKARKQESKKARKQESKKARKQESKKARKHFF
jgi:hypothetical protein